MSFHTLLLFIALIFLFIYLCLSCIIAVKFERIAKEKGHSGYFGWCFWLGIIGYLMVIALPDRKIPYGSQIPNKGQPYYNNTFQQNSRQNSMSQARQASANNAPPNGYIYPNKAQQGSNNIWICPKCSSVNNPNVQFCSDCRERHI